MTLERFGLCSNEVEAVVSLQAHYCLYLRARRVSPGPVSQALAVPAVMVGAERVPPAGVACSGSGCSLG
jgi:hypothetical protein